MPAFTEIAPICLRERQPSPHKWLRESKNRSNPAAYAFKKDLRHRARQAYAEHVANRKAQQWMRSLSRELANSQQAPTTAHVERRFRQLAAEWKNETGSVSSLTALVAHPKYRAIVKLDWDVVPFLLRDLQDNHGFWSPALHEITKIAPFDPRDVGNSKRITEAWIQWGKKKKLI